MPDEPQDKKDVNRQGLDEFVGYQVRMAYVAISRHFASAMAEFDLTQKQTGVLWLIGANGGVSQIALANELGMDRASMMVIVDRLEERGLIVRKRSAQDGRKQELYATAKGRKILTRARAVIAQHENWIANRFTDRELTHLKDFLKRIHG